MSTVVVKTMKDDLYERYQGITQKRIIQMERQNVNVLPAGLQRATVFRRSGGTAPGANAGPSRSKCGMRIHVKVSAFTLEIDTRANPEIMGPPPFSSKKSVKWIF